METPIVDIDPKSLHSSIVPSGGLSAHERAGGYLLDRHVGKTDADLALRLANSRLKAASTFNSRAEAERVAAETIDANKNIIIQFIRRPDLRLVIDYRGNNIGRVLEK